MTKNRKDRDAAADRLAHLGDTLATSPDWNEDGLERQVLATAEVMGVDAGKLIHPLRLALTGMAVTPGIFEVMNLMGRALVLSRIDDAISHLEGA